MRTIVSVGAMAMLALVAGIGLRAGDQVTGENGAELFANYCATCHGRDGKGGGPTAVTLKFATPDLTTIATRSGGKFPYERIRAVVAGPENLFIPAHGTTDMPVWGPTFRALDPAGPNEARITRIVEYLAFLNGAAATPQP